MSKLLAIALPSVLLLAGAAGRTAASPRVTCATPWARAARFGMAPEIEPPTTSSLAAGEPAQIARPTQAFWLGTTHFVVHYDDAALAAYADSLGRYLEIGWRGLVDTLGYLAPPADGTAGGDGRVDVYVVGTGFIPFGGVGVTVPEDSIPGTTGINDFTSFCAIVDTLGVDDLRATAVHEFFHTVHFGYDGQEDIWFYEMLSTWSEERMAGDSNFYYRYMDGIFGRPEKRLTSHIYANVIWAIHNVETFGEGVLLEMLQECIRPWGGNALAATDTVLVRHGSSLVEGFRDYAVWNLFTASADDGLHYPEGFAYPPVWKEVTGGCSPVAGHVASRPLSVLSTGYLEIAQDGSERPLQIDFLGQATGTWGVHVVRFLGGSGHTVQDVALAGGSGSVTIADWPALDRVVVVVTCLGVVGGGGTQGYMVSATHPPQASGPTPYVLVLDRDACLRPFDGVRDDFGPGEGSERPWTLALDSLGVAVRLGDRLPLDLAGCSAIFLLSGYGPAGINLADAELDSLLAFMGRGGDVYLEARRAAHYYGSGSARAQAFFASFMVSASDGNPMSAGNVQTLSGVGAGTPFEGLLLDYDAMGVPDDSLEILHPAAGTDTLCVDQAGRVRMTGRKAGTQASVLGTVLLGGLRDAPAARRSDLVWAVLSYMENPVGVVSVVGFEIFPAPDGLRLAWSIGGTTGGTYRVGGRRVPDDDASRKPAPYVWFEAGVVDGRARYRAVYGLDPGPGAHELLIAIRDEGGIEHRFGPYRYVPPGSRDLVLHPNVPNPFNPHTRIEFDLYVESPIRLSVFDAAGRRVERRELGLLEPGRYVEEWPLGPYPSGVYFLRIEGHGFHAVRKIVLVE